MDILSSPWILVHVRSIIVNLTGWHMLCPPARGVLTAAGTGGFHRRLFAECKGDRACLLDAVGQSDAGGMI